RDWSSDVCSSDLGTKLKNIHIGAVEVEGLDKPINKDLHPYVFYLNNSEVEDLLIKRIIAKNVRYVLATNEYSTSVIQNMVVNEMYVDATAVNITILRNPFDNERPSYLHNVFVKDIEDIYLDRESKNYREGEYFVSTNNLFIGNFSEGPHL